MEVENIEGNIETKFLFKLVWRETLQTFRISFFFFFYVNFENLTIEFHVPYVLNMHIKICSNWMLFIIQLIKLFFIHNFRSQKLENLTFI